MSIARSFRNHPLRLTSTVLVLVSAATVVGACSSGEPAVDEQVAAIQQGLNWTGGCACLPVASCPASSLNYCVRPPTTSDGCGLTVRCLAGTTWCYVDKDGVACTTSSGGKTGTCDGGYCGKCPGCYTKTGLCYPGDELAACGSGGVACDSCNDGNECTKDTCGSTGCLNTVLSNGTACTGGTCYAGKCCTGCIQNGVCQAGSTGDACGIGGTTCAACISSSNPCVKTYCGAAGTCVTENVDLGTSCSDGNVCNGDETCDGNGNCRAGTSKDCTTGDPCITGNCNPTLGCVKSINVNATCSDGNGCTIGDKCDSAGACIGGPLNPCTDGNTCTSDSCDPATGKCLNPALPNDTACDDGAACTQGEKCLNGVCTAGATTCDDGKFCTKDTPTCSAGTPCSFDPLPMNGQSCELMDKCVKGTCTAGSCVGGAAVNCDDGNPCTKDGCDPATGCTHTPEPATTVCVDGNPCTTDDHCRPLTGKCAGTPTVCAALDDCHSPGTCDSTTGRCDDPRRIDGFPCANNTGSCQSGVCRISATGGAAGAAGVAGAAGELGLGGNAGSAGNPDAAGTAGIAGEVGIVGSGGSTTTTSTPGASGENALGGTTGVTSGGKSSTGGKGGSTVDEGDVYQRNPGGCSCNLPGRSSSPGLVLLGLLGLALGIGRKRRD